MQIPQKKPRKNFFHGSKGFNVFPCFVLDNMVVQRTGIRVKVIYYVVLIYTSNQSYVAVNVIYIKYTDLFDVIPLHF